MYIDLIGTCAIYLSYSSDKSNILVADMSYEIRKASYMGMNNILKLLETDKIFLLVI